jgi:ABC-type multidrug transport system fused ATPase/permease subunit
MWEVAGNSVERLQEYMSVPSEKAQTEEGVPPAYWPASGSIDIKNLTAVCRLVTEASLSAPTNVAPHRFPFQRYSADGPVVLDKLTLSIPSGKRVGVIGRTGSGAHRPSLVSVQSLDR